MNLKKESVRGPNFHVMVQNSSGTYDSYTPGEVRSYIGTVNEDPAAMSAGYLLNNGTLLGVIYFDRGGTWFTTNGSVTSTRGFDTPTYTFPSDSTVTAGHAGSYMYEYGVGVDVDYRDYSLAYGSSVEKTVQYVEYNFALFKPIQMSNALIKPCLERLIIRASQSYCPYDGTTGTAILPLVRDEWETNQSDALAYCLKVSQVTTAIGGGVAYGSGRYTVSDTSESTGLFLIVWRHEMGHNWGIGDWDANSPEYKTINCGNSYARYCGTGIQDMLNHRDNNLGSLTNAGTYVYCDLPPYASLDTAVFTQTVDAEININPIANDHDANAEALSLLSFDSVSANGSPITLSGSGSGATLVYSPPSGDFLGFDWFAYEVQDAGGQTATGIVNHQR